MPDDLEGQVQKKTQCRQQQNQKLHVQIGFAKTGIVNTLAGLQATTVIVVINPLSRAVTTSTLEACRGCLGWCQKARDFLLLARILQSHPDEDQDLVRHLATRIQHVDRVADI